MNNKYIINTRTIEDLPIWAEMILSIKGAVEEIKKADNEELKAFYGYFIANTMDQLKNDYNISKDDVFKYRFNFIK